MTTTVVTEAGGVRFDISIRGHTIQVDQPVRGGGTDTALMPLELLDAALGACVAYYAHQFLAGRLLSTEGLRVELKSEKSADSPRRIAHFAIRVELPEGVPESLLPLLERAVKSCPVHNTLAHPPEIEFEIAAPEMVMGRVF